MLVCRKGTLDMFYKDSISGQVDSQELSPQLDELQKGVPFLRPKSNASWKHSSIKVLRKEMT